jgi:hypothetical protein
MPLGSRDVLYVGKAVAGASYALNEQVGENLIFYLHFHCVIYLTFILVELTRVSSTRTN